MRQVVFFSRIALNRCFELLWIASALDRKFLRITNLLWGSVYTNVYQAIIGKLQVTRNYELKLDAILSLIPSKCLGKEIHNDLHSQFIISAVQLMTCHDSENFCRATRFISTWMGQSTHIIVMFVLQKISGFTVKYSFILHSWLSGVD